MTLEDGSSFELDHGRVVIAAITSCTNTSNPSVMIGAGLLARNAIRRGLARKPWVKTSLAPGSTVVTDYLRKAGLTEHLDALQFNLVGYGCTTCIGNSGPLRREISAAIAEKDLAVCAVLSGNRNFEGRINQDVKANYLASPPLVVAYALAGPDGPRPDDRAARRGLRRRARLPARHLAEHPRRSRSWSAARSPSEMFTRNYAEVFAGDENWNAVEVPAGNRYTWPDSTYVRRPQLLRRDAAPTPPGVEPIERARVLAVLGDSITTDHISPAGAIKKDSPAGQVAGRAGGRAAGLQLLRLPPRQPRGDDPRHLRQHPPPQPTGGEGEGVSPATSPTGRRRTIYEAAMAYAEGGSPLVVLAGKEYGSGSSRDWAAKGTKLLGVGAVIAESFERIHRSNLIGMGVLPLQFPDGESIDSLRPRPAKR